MGGVGWGGWGGWGGGEGGVESILRVSFAIVQDFVFYFLWESMLKLRHSTVSYFIFTMVLHD